MLLPVVQAVLPYLTALAKVVTSAVKGLGALLGVKGSDNNTASEVEKTSNGIGGMSSNLDNANKSAKKLKGTLAGFDEMNVISDNSSDSSSAGTDTSAGGVGGALDFNLDEYKAGLDGISSKADAIAEKIKTVFGGVGEVLKNVWNSEPVQVFADAVSTYGQYIWDFWSTMGINLRTNITETWGNISGNVGTYLENMKTLWVAFWTDINGGIQKWGKPIIDGVSGIFNSIWKDVIDPVCQQITTVWADFSGILVDLWNKHGKELIDNIGEFVTNVIALFQKIWDDILSPIITPFLETLSWLWDKHLKDLVSKVGDFIGKLVNGALEIYNKFIQPIIMWLIDKLAPAWAFLSSTVIGVFGTILGTISDVIGSIIGILGGVIDFIVGVFTGNWKKAWDGVKSIFSNLWDGLVGIVKMPINFIIDIINGFIAGLNKIQVPDWVPVVGGKGINIPKIPKLARGGIIDEPTYAMIGEAGKEAVMPLERNTGWIDQLASKINASNGDGTPIQLVVRLGEETIFNKFIEYSRAKSFETNGEVFAV